MDPSDVVRVEARPPQQQPSDPAKSRSKRNQQKRNQRNSEPGDANRQRPKIDRSLMSGFGDGVERAFCSAVASRPPRGYPVQHRTGVTVKMPIIVAEGESSLLFCDCEHTGPHIWPNGDIVERPS
jgi:hypothetical protein